MLQIFFKTFTTIFFAELGDKTQLATMASASTVASQHHLIVFAASAAALVLSSAIAVLLGVKINKFVSPKTIQIIAGCVFIIFGLAYLKDAFCPAKTTAEASEPAAAPAQETSEPQTRQ